MLDTSQPHMAKTVKPENFKPGKLLDVVFAYCFPVDENGKGIVIMEYFNCRLRYCSDLDVQ
jgi:hypothetical protein